MASEQLEIVEEWKKKSYEFSTQSDDVFVPLISSGHEVVSLVLKNADHSRIKNALFTLDFERSSALSFENSSEPSIRSMMYGAVESYHLAIGHLIDQINKPSTVKWTQTGETLTADHVISDVVFKEEEIVEKESGSPYLVIDDSAASANLDNISTAPTFCHSFPLYKLELSENPSIPTENQISPKESVGDQVIIKKEEITKEEIMDDDSMPYMNFKEIYAPLRKEVKEETEAIEYCAAIPVEYGSINEQDYDVMDGTAQDEMFDNNMDSIEDDIIEREGKKEKDKTDKSADATENSSVAEMNNKRRRSSRRVSKPLEYLESEGDSEVDEVPSMNKSKSESKNTNGRKRKSANEDASKSVSVKKERRVVKSSDTELKCSECEYRSHSVPGWLAHLRIQHYTTPSLSGLALRCECGNEGVSADHNYKCDISNFTVIRKSTGRIRRLDDEKLTPQCILCDKYPKTAYSYARHLQDVHKSTLIANDIHLKCECGSTYTSEHNANVHVKECEGRRFSLHKNTDD